MKVTQQTILTNADNMSPNHFKAVFARKTCTIPRSAPFFWASGAGCVLGDVVWALAALIACDNHHSCVMHKPGQSLSLLLAHDWEEMGLLIWPPGKSTLAVA